MPDTPVVSEPGAMLTALGTVVMTTIAALEQTGALTVDWTDWILAQSREIIGQLVRDEVEQEAVLRSLGTVEAMLGALREMAAASARPVREH